jgi:hypothetical protein
VRKVRGPGITPAEDQALGALRNALQLRNGETLAGWNDRASQTVTKVRRVVVQAAELLESRL